EDERELDPEVAAHVIVADSERKADRGKDQRRDPAELALEEHGARNRPAEARMPPSRIEHPPAVASDRRRQHLPDRVRREVGADEPGQVLADPARTQKLLPPPGHGPD